MSTYEMSTGGRVLTVIADMAPFRHSVVGPEAQLRDELGFDSLSLLELAAALEDEFGLPTTAGLDAEVADTAADVVRIVEDKLAAVQA